MRRLLTGLLAVALLTSACGDDDDPDDRAAVTSIPDETTTSSTTTEPATVAPDVIPADERQITEEYVEQVLDSLFEVSLEALLATRTAGLVDDHAIRLSEDIHSPKQAIRAINSLADLARQSFSGFKDDPQPVDARVLEVHAASARCVFAEATFDTSGLVNEPPTTPEGARTFVQLVPADDQQRAGANPTAWVIDDLPASEDGSVPSSTCAVS